MTQGYNKCCISPLLFKPIAKGWGLLPPVMRYASLALCTLSRLDWPSSNGMSEMSLAVWWSVRKCSDTFTFCPKYTNKKILDAERSPVMVTPPNVFHNLLTVKTEALYVFHLVLLATLYCCRGEMWPHTDDPHYWTTSSFKTFLQIHGATQMALLTRTFSYQDLKPRH